MRVVRNVAIILLLAVPVAFVPGGGNVAQAILLALTMGFLAGISWLIYTTFRQNQLTLATLSDARRALLYGGVGLIVLLIAGADEMLGTGGGTLAWILLLGISVAAIWRVWMEANSY
jgi:hypothetical protein